MLRRLHGLLTELRTACGMQAVSDLRQEALWNEFARASRPTPLRAKQLSAYSALSTKHLPAFLQATAEADTATVVRGYQLPPLPEGYLARVGMANQLNTARRMQTRRTRALLLPMFPRLAELVVLRQQLFQLFLREIAQVSNTEELVDHMDLPPREDYTITLTERIEEHPNLDALWQKPCRDRI